MNTCISSLNYNSIVFNEHLFLVEINLPSPTPAEILPNSYRAVRPLGHK
jgi:hypothetical protein